MTYREQFCKIIESMTGCSIYTWGGNGEDLLQMSDAERAAYFARKERADSGRTKDQNIALCEQLFQKLKGKGCKEIRAFDCSGLVYYALKQIFTSQRDMTAASFYGRCDPSTAKTGLKISDLRPGDLVFKDKGSGIVHVGVYLGNLKIIDAAGRVDGVVKRSITSDFNRFGVWPALDQNQPRPSPGKKYVKVKGSKERTVWIRTKAGTGKDCKKYKVARGGETYPLLGRAETDPTWYNIDVAGKSLWITDKPAYTEVIEK